MSKPNSFRFVSADSHVNEPLSLFRERCPSALQDRVPRFEEVDGGSLLLIEGLRPRKMPGGIDMEKADLAGAAQAGGWDPARRMADQDADGVAAEVVFPTMALQACFSTSDPVLQMALARAYNDWAIEIFSPHPNRFAVAGICPVLDLEEAAREARRLVDAGIRCLMLPALVADRPYNDAAYDDFWALAVELGVPLTFHSGTGHEPRVARGPGGAVINYLLGSQIDGAHVMLHFSAGGALDRFPGLRIVTVETGAAWLAWVMTQADEIYDRHHMWASPKLSCKPSELIRRQCHATFQHDPVAVKNRDVTGIEPLMWGSDYPHPEGTWPESQRICADQLSGVGEADQRAILRDNAAKVFGFDLSGV